MTLPIKCKQIDSAIAALIIELEQRGLLDEALVVEGGKLWLTPMMQNNVQTEREPGYIGRDDHPPASPPRAIHD